MNFAPLFSHLKGNGAPPHAKEVIVGLLTCIGTRKVTPEHFAADPDLQALSRLGLVRHEATCLVPTESAYTLAGMVPAKTTVAVEI